MAFLLFDIGAAIGIAITSAVLNTRLHHLLPNTMISTEYVSMIIQDPMTIRSRKLPQQYFQTALDIYAQSLRDSFLVLLAFPAIGILIKKRRDSNKIYGHPLPKKKGAFY